MKKLFTLVLISISLIGFSQDSSTQKNEIGVNIFSINAIQSTPGNVNLGSTVSLNFLTGFTYKHYMGQNVLRVGADYNYSYEEYYDGLIMYGTPSSSNVKYTNTFLRLEGRLGYERLIKAGKFQYFIGVDGIIGYDWRKSTGYELVDFDNGSNYYDYSNRFLRLGVSPVVGIQYFITPRLSTTLEVSLNVVRTFNMDNNTIFESNGVTVEFLPIRLLSVNYHF